MKLSDSHKIPQEKWDFKIIDVLITAWSRVQVLAGPPYSSYSNLILYEKGVGYVFCLSEERIFEMVRESEQRQNINVKRHPAFCFFENFDLLAKISIYILKPITLYVTIIMDNCKIFR